MTVDSDVLLAIVSKIVVSRVARRLGVPSIINKVDVHHFVRQWRRYRQLNRS